MNHFLDRVSDARFVPLDDDTVRVLVSGTFRLGFDLNTAEAEGVKLAWRSSTRCYVYAVTACAVFALFVPMVGLSLLCLSWLLKTYIVQATRHDSKREVSLEKDEFDSFYDQLSRSVSRRSANLLRWLSFVVMIAPIAFASTVEHTSGLLVDTSPFMGFLLLGLGWFLLFAFLAKSPRANAYWDKAKQT